MSMSRKDYVAVARVLSHVADNFPDYLTPNEVTNAVAELLADVYAKDDPRFDRGRFLSAAKGVRPVKWRPWCNRRAVFGRQTICNPCDEEIDKRMGVSHAEEVK